MSDLKVVKISDSQPCGSNVVERLEEALDRAKQGGVQNCIIVMSCDQGVVLDCWANGRKPFEMVGALETVKHDFMSACMEGRG